MSQCPHCQKPIAGTFYKPLTEEDAKALRSRNTGTESQEARILAALRTGPKTTDDLRKLGIYQASARIYGLRERGHVIDMTPFDGYSADGYTHARMALYELKGEPLLPDARPIRKRAQKPAEGASGEAAA